MSTATKSVVYIIHLSSPLGQSQSDESRSLHGLGARSRPYTAHVQHYIGCTHDLYDRVQRHRNGNGARLLQYANRQNIPWRVVAWREGYREEEIQVKKQKNSKRFCPLCSKKLPEGWHELTEEQWERLLDHQEWR